MGYPVEIFQSTVQKEYLCSVCNQVMENPIECTDCPRAFCRACYSFQSTAQICPKCSTKSPPKEIPLKIRSVIENLIIKCENCKEQMMLKGYREHFINCMNQNSFYEESIGQPETQQLTKVQAIQQDLKQTQALSQPNEESNKELEAKEASLQEKQSNQSRNQSEVDEINQEEQVQMLQEVLKENQINNKLKIAKMYKELNKISENAKNLIATKQKSQQQLIQLQENLDQLKQDFSKLDQKAKSSVNKTDYLLQKIDQSQNDFQSGNSSNGKLDEENFQSKLYSENPLLERLKILEEKQINQEIQVRGIEKEQKEFKEVKQKRALQIQNSQQDYSIQNFPESFELEQLKGDCDSKLESLKQMINFIQEKHQKNIISQFFQNKQQKVEQNYYVELAFNPSTSHKSFQIDSTKTEGQFPQDFTYKTTVFPKPLLADKVFSAQFQIKKGDQFILGVTKKIHDYEKSFTFFNTG